MAAVISIQHSSAARTRCGEADLGEFRDIASLLRAMQDRVGASAAYCAIQPLRARVAQCFCLRGDAPQRRVVRRHLCTVLDGAWRSDEGFRLELPRDASGLAAALEGLFELEAAERTWLVLCDSDVLLGAFGFERRFDDPTFTRSDRANIEDVAALLRCMMRVTADLIDSATELALVQALGGGYERVLLFDTGSQSIVWGSKAGKSIDWGTQAEPLERLLFTHCAELVEAHARGEILPLLPEVELGVIRGFVPLSEPTAIGSGDAAIGIGSPEARGTGLSAREGQVARFLARGYEPANIAAITGVTEHTVRTYIRRAYKKLGVTTRAELVFRLLSRSFV